MLLVGGVRAAPGPGTGTNAPSWKLMPGVLGAFVFLVLAEVVEVEPNPADDPKDTAAGAGDFLADESAADGGGGVVTGADVATAAAADPPPPKLNPLPMPAAGFLALPALAPPLVLLLPPPNGLGAALDMGGKPAAALAEAGAGLVLLVLVLVLLALAPPNGFLGAAKLMGGNAAAAEEDDDGVFFAGGAAAEAPKLNPPPGAGAEAEDVPAPPKENGAGFFFLSALPPPDPPKLRPSRLNDMATKC